jgi:hypothetical protein
MNNDGKYAIWTGNGGYFSGSFGAGPAFRSDPMFAVKFDSEWEAEQKAKNLGLDGEYDIRQVE